MTKSIQISSIYDSSEATALAEDFGIDMLAAFQEVGRRFGKGEIKYGRDMIPFMVAGQESLASKASLKYEVFDSGDRILITFHTFRKGQMRRSIYYKPNSHRTAARPKPNPEEVRARQVASARRKAKQEFDEAKKRQYHEWFIEKVYPKLPHPVRNPYIQKKGLQGFKWFEESGLRHWERNGGLIVPFQNLQTGEVAFFQNFDPKHGKKHIAGGNTQVPAGVVFGYIRPQGGPRQERKRKIIFFEGVADAMSAYLALDGDPGFACVAVGGVNRLSSAIEAVKDINPHARFVIAADDDYQGQAVGQGVNRGVNTGIYHAILAHDAHLKSGYDEIRIASYKCEKFKDFSDMYLSLGLKPLKTIFSSKRPGLESKVNRALSAYNRARQDIEYGGLKGEVYLKNLAEKGILAAKVTNVDEYREAVFECNKHLLRSDDIFAKVESVWLKAHEKFFNEAKNFYLPEGHVSRLHFLPNTEHPKIDLRPEHIETGIVTLVKAPTGAGKSESLAKIIKEAESATMILGNRQSLSSNFTKQEGIHNYLDAEHGEMCSLTKKAVSIQSINAKSGFYGEAYMRQDLVVVDEATAALAEMHRGIDRNTERRKERFNVLKKIIESGKKVVFVCADFDRSTMRAIKKLTNKSIKTLSVNREDWGKTLKGKHVRISPVKKAEELVFKNLNEGHAVRVSVTARKQAEKLAYEYKQRYGNDGVLVLTSKTKDDEPCAAFIENPNKECVKYRLLVHTSTMETGLSITVRHFTKTIGITADKNCSPQNFIQMIRRDRTANDIVIGMHQSNWSTNNRDKKSWAYHRKSNDSVKDLDEFDITMLEREEFIRPRWNVLLVGILKSQGVTVSTCEEETKVLISDFNEEMESQKEREIEKILAAKSITDAEFREIQRKFTTTEEERYQSKKHKIKKSLGRPIIDKTDVEFCMEKGAQGFLNVGDYLSISKAEAAQYHSLLKETACPIINMKRPDFLKRLLEEITFKLGLDISKLEGGRFSEDQCYELLENMRRSKDLSIAYEHCGYLDSWDKTPKPLKSFKCPTKFVSMVLKKLFGLKIIETERDSSRTRWYTVEPKALKRFSEYLRNRNSSGLNYPQTEIARLQLVKGEQQQEAAIEQEETQKQSAIPPGSEWLIEELGIMPSEYEELIHAPPEEQREMVRRLRLLA